MTLKRLKNTSPAEALATALDNTLIPLSHLASKARITPFHAERAIRGRLVTTGPYLRLCVALGFNPLPEIPHAEPVLGDFDSVMLAMRLRLHRNFNDRSVVEAASDTGMRLRLRVDGSIVRPGGTVSGPSSIRTSTSSFG